MGQFLIKHSLRLGDNQGSVADEENGESEHAAAENENEDLAEGNSRQTAGGQTTERL